MERSKYSKDMYVGPKFLFDLNSVRRSTNNYNHVTFEPALLKLASQDSDSSSSPLGFGPPPPKRRRPSVQRHFNLDPQPTDSQGLQNRPTQFPIQSNSGQTVANFKEHTVTNASIMNGNGISSSTESIPDIQVKEEFSVPLPRKDLTPWEENIVRLIGQYLRRMGYHQTVSNLVRESGCRLEHVLAATFRQKVLSGDWPGAEKALVDLSSLLEDQQIVHTMRFLLLEQKYLELLETKQDIEALQCLREEISPLLPQLPQDTEKTERVHQLSSCMMCRSVEELKTCANWSGSKGDSRQLLVERLECYLPVQAVLPGDRMDELLRQSLQWQISQCPCHNMYVVRETEHEGLLQDHLCSDDLLPSETRFILKEHTDEVWFLQFSHDGSKLASGCKDGKIIIYDFSIIITEDYPSSSPALLHTLTAQAGGIGYLSWSPDDKHIISCGREESSELMVFSSDTGEIRCTVNNTREDSLTSCAWLDTDIFCTGGTKGQFYQCDLEGSVIEQWEGLRVTGLHVLKDPKLVLAADTHMRIRQYHFESHNDTNLIQESDPILSFSVSPDGGLALLNLSNQGLHLWDLEDRALVRHYTGISQGYYAIHSCFGGLNCEFLASGSEDGFVYLWHKSNEKPILKLSGHSRTVNSVHWNPIRPDILASSSDDATIRVWMSKLRQPSATRGSKRSFKFGSRRTGDNNPNSKKSTHTAPSIDRQISPPHDHWQQRHCSPSTPHTSQHHLLNTAAPTARLISLGPLGQLLAQGMLPFHALDTSTGIISLSAGTGSDSRTSSEGSTAV
ncbi:hypothetical protein LOD99_14437 [Oopsacas minuta]|uniref:CTLH domain-containing protein n=1 Tax=Oopsacas minuta TaxID=111878 RepID=A0AAV7KFA5_9METZ|nr:hypothetical protein LOD99_14437 [Oopsacas minuta]